MNSPRTPATRIRRIRQALLRWYAKQRRDLPWRRTRDPYAIWISETMLQQTRVDTVIPYYERFLETFPDIEALAAADQDDVYGQWAGLGYYSRARNLHAAAKMMVAEFDAHVPESHDALMRLPGVGRYTAGAVASIAFDRPEPIVDGNVVRVLSRVLGIREDVGSKPVVERLWAEAAALARCAKPGDLNQAMMELGATVCSPRSPSCEACPVARACDALRAGDAESLPRKAARSKPRAVTAAAIWLERRGRFLAVRRRAGGLLGGLWEPPGFVLPADASGASGGRGRSGAVVRQLREQLGLDIAPPKALGEVSHVFTHRLLRLHVFHCDQLKGRARYSDFDAYRWVSARQLGELPQSSLTRKAAGLLG